jgi:hypothetical protein
LGIYVGEGLEGVEEVAEFFIDEGGVGDGVGDFFAEELAVAFAEAMGGDLQGAFGGAETGGEVGVGAVEFAGEGALEGFEEGELVFVGIFGFEAGDDGVEKGEGPATVEELLGGLGVGGVEGALGFGVVGGEGEDVEAAPAFEGVLVVVVVGEEVVEGGEEEGAEFAFGGVDGFEGIGFEEAGEEFLGEIFGEVGGIAAAAEVGIQGRPVEAGELFERGVAEGGGGVVAGGEDDAPAGGVEMRVG